jgi:hypothetical protein
VGLEDERTGAAAGAEEGGEGLGEQGWAAEEREVLRSVRSQPDAQTV